MRLGLTLSLATASLPAQAATLTVDESGSAGFSSIQAAVTQAQDGDRIEVLAGTYETAVNPDGKNLHFLAVGAVLLLPESDPLTPIFTFNSNETASSQVEGAGPIATTKTPSRLNTANQRNPRAAAHVPAPSVPPKAQ